MHNFDFDKITAAHFPCKARNADSRVGISGTGRIRKQCDTLRDIVQNIFAVFGIGTSDSQRDNLRTGIGYGCAD